MGKEGLLSGYRVLDLCNEKGDLCGKIFGDLSADVIKVEPPGGSPSRKIGPFYQDDPDSEKSLFWFAFNANKRSITIDLEAAQGREIFRRLAKKSDIVLESFDPGYMDSLGLGYEQLSSTNPGLIVTSITPFGQQGPYHDYKGPDMVVFALGGLMSLCGDADRPPVQISFSQSYIAASTYAAEGTMIALHERETSGLGQHIDVSAQATITWFISELLPFWTFLQRNISRAGGTITRVVKDGIVHVPMTWQCKGGYVNYMIQGGLPGAERNIRMAKWLVEERLATQYVREKTDKDWYELDWAKLTKKDLQEEFIEPLSKLFSRYTSQELYDEALKRVITLFPLSTSEYLVEENAQLKARNFWVPVHHDALNADITYPGPFVSMSETGLNKIRRAPAVGEHNREIYIGELGFSPDDLIALKGANVI